LFAPSEEDSPTIEEETPKIEENLTESGVFAWLTQLQKHRKSVTENLAEEAAPPIKEQEELVTDEEIGLDSQIREAAYYLSLKKYSYNDLCWLLAESIQNVRLDMPSLEDIREKAEEVYNSSSTYDELCWLNAQMDILIEQQFLEKKNKYN
jgi:hypothetical protein